MKKRKCKKPEEPITDRAFWLEEIDDPQASPWLEAIEAIDKHGEMKLLLALMQPNVPASALRFVEDLFARLERELQKKPGRPRPAIYEFPQANLEIAKEYVNDLVANCGFTFANAIEEAAKLDRVPSSTLELYCTGRHAAARRFKQRVKQKTK